MRRIIIIFALVVASIIGVLLRQTARTERREISVSDQRRESGAPYSIDVDIQDAGTSRLDTPPVLPLPPSATVLHVGNGQKTVSGGPAPDLRLVSYAPASSVDIPADLFGKASQRRFLDVHPNLPRNAAVKLKSRYYIPEHPVNVPGIETAAGEFYVTFAHSPSPELKRELAAAGIRVIEHVTRLTWRVYVESGEQVPSTAEIKGIEPVWPVDKWSPGLWSLYRQSGIGEREMVFSFNEDVDFEDAKALMVAAGAATEAEDFYFHHRVYAVSGADTLVAMTRSPHVRSAELPPPPDMLNNAGAATLSDVDDIQAAPLYLTGTNVPVMVRDGGEVSLHPDFGSPSRVTVVQETNASTHATHVAGTIAGSGAGSSSAKGMAPAALIYSYTYKIGYSATEIASGYASNACRISNHSYGSVIGWYQNDEDVWVWAGYTNYWGDYRSGSEDWDIVAASADLLICKSAGNDRNDDGPGPEPHDGTYYDDPSISNPYYDLIEYRGCAKNVFTVGAVSGSKTITTFSCTGPTDDGRIKPDLVADGQSLYSTINTTSYGSLSGTSMSTPVLSGILAVLTELYQRAFDGSEPGHAVMKALLVNTAEDLGRAGPDYVYGWGLADAGAAAETLTNNSSSSARILRGAVRESETNTYTLTLDSAATPLKMTLAWTDLAGNPTAADALKNDLDITLTAPGGGTVHYPYIMPYAQSGASPTNPAVTGTNEWDNIEQIEVASASTGVWTIAVAGTTVPGGNQDYVLVLNAGHVLSPALEADPTNVALSAIQGGSDRAMLTISNSGAAELLFTVGDNAYRTNYIWRDSNDAGGPEYAWIDIEALGTDISLADDGESELIGIGFSFPFYRVEYRQFMIGANGGISFFEDGLNANNQSLPTFYAPTALVAAFWDDLNPAAGGSITYHSTADRLVVSWLNVPRYDTADEETFQIIIYPDGRIVLQYKELNGLLTSCTVGLQNDQYVGPTAQIVYESAYLETNLAIELTEHWLAGEPLTGSVSMGGVTSVWITADSAGLNAGTHTADVVIAANDPERPETRMPVLFTVYGDEDGDSMPDFWEDRHGGGITNLDAATDNDGDGLDNIGEYIANTDPTNAQSVLAIDAVRNAANGTNYVITWQSASNRIYGLSWMTNLLGWAYDPLASNLPATPPQNIWTDTAHGAEDRGYYRIDVRLP